MDMDKFENGLIIGFFLATFLVFGMAQIYFSPFQQDMEKIRPYVQSANDITNSDNYNKASAFVEKIATTADQLAAIPILGTTSEASEIIQYSHTATQLMKNIKEITGTTLNMLDTVRGMIQMSFYAVPVSLVVLVYGVWQYKYAKPAKAAAKKKGRRR